MAKHKNEFYVCARTMNRSEEYASKDNTQNINVCISYAMRYVECPTMADNRITDYSKDEDTVKWFYLDHKDGKKYNCFNVTHLH